MTVAQLCEYIDVHTKGMYEALRVDYSAADLCRNSFSPVILRLQYYEVGKVPTENQSQYFDFKYLKLNTQGEWGNASPCEGEPGAS